MASNYIPKAKRGRTFSKADYDAFMRDYRERRDRLGGVGARVVDVGSGNYHEYRVLPEAPLMERDELLDQEKTFPIPTRIIQPVAQGKPRSDYGVTLLVSSWIGIFIYLCMR